jgi:hypothetical protein
MDEDAALQVCFHGAAGEVGAANQDDAVVDNDDLGMQGCSRRPLSGFFALEIGGFHLLGSSTQRCEVALTGMRVRHAVDP